MPEAFEHLLGEEEAQRLVDMETVARAAVSRVEQAGIIFIDEIDKIAGREGGKGPDVSREGVQRDILPIVEGTTVHTKYGMVKTDHILFIAAGAFHVSKPSDLIPELQGRFPIRVELEALGRDDFVRILTEPKSALVKQYVALLSHRRRDAAFTDDAIVAIAAVAAEVNERAENIGARRLHTVMERLLDEVSFEGPELPDRRLRLTRRTSPHAADRSPGRRSVPIHLVSMERSAHETRRLVRFSTALLVTLATVACGKKGPPLAPLRLVPAAVTDVSVRVTGQEVHLRFGLPNKNLNGPGRMISIGSKSTRSRCPLAAGRRPIVICSRKPASSAQFP